jgi:hypothetical protein
MTVGAPVCNVCRFYDAWSQLVGECRRHAPGALTLDRRQLGDPEDLIAAWPTVQAGDWCGEFQPSLSGVR